MRKFHIETLSCAALLYATRHVLVVVVSHFLRASNNTYFYYGLTRRDNSIEILDYHRQFCLNMELKQDHGDVPNIAEKAESRDLQRDIGPERRTGPKLERYISLVPSVAFNAVLQASWSAVAVSFQAGLLNGGPTSLVWGMLLSWVGTTAVAASLAEMASINPSVGAQ